MTFNAVCQGYLAVYGGDGAAAVAFREGEGVGVGAMENVIRLD